MQTHRHWLWPPCHACAAGSPAVLPAPHPCNGGSPDLLGVTTDPRPLEPGGCSEDLW